MGDLYLVTGGAGFMGSHLVDGLLGFEPSVGLKAGIRLMAAAEVASR